MLIQGTFIIYILMHYKESSKSWKLTQYFQQPSISITVLLEIGFKSCC